MSRHDIEIMGKAIIEGFIMSTREKCECHTCTLARLHPMERSAIMNERFHTRMVPYVEMIERFRGCVEIDSKRIHELEEQNVRLRARLDELESIPPGSYLDQLRSERDVYRTALEKISDFKMSSIDKAYLLIQCEGFQSVARAALEKGRGNGR